MRGVGAGFGAGDGATGAEDEDVELAGGDDVTGGGTGGLDAASVSGDVRDAGDGAGSD